MTILTWRERCEIHPDHQSGMITDVMIERRMQEEIDELREKLDFRNREPPHCPTCECGIASLGDLDGPGEEDGPWAEGWDSRRTADEPPACRPDCWACEDAGHIHDDDGTVEGCPGCFYEG